MATLTHEERFDIIQQSLVADAAGDPDESTRILKKLPLAPHLAMGVKEIWGKEILIDGGYDLSEAEATYGKDWLDK